jgi:hypothetical protein
MGGPGSDCEIVWILSPAHKQFDGSRESASVLLDRPRIEFPGALIRKARADGVQIHLAEVGPLSVRQSCHNAPRGNGQRLDRGGGDRAFVGRVADGLDRYSVVAATGTRPNRPRLVTRHDPRTSLTAVAAIARRRCAVLGPVYHKFYGTRAFGNFFLSAFGKQCRVRASLN